MGRAPVRVAPVALAIVSALFVLVYLLLHWALPQAGSSYFWTDAPPQWLDWLFWSGIGILLRMAAKRDDLSAPSRRRSLSPDNTIWNYLVEFLKSLTLIFVVLWAVVNVVDIDLEGLKIDLKQAPEIGVALAFVLGFYPDLLRTVFGHILQFLQRYAERLLSRSLSARAVVKEQAYVSLHVDPRLQAAYWLAASTPAGLPGHWRSFERRVSYRVVGFLNRSGFTVNALRIVFIAQDLLSPSDKETLIEIIAHEASHIEQGWWSDSVKQEVEAYRRGATVMQELKQAGKVSTGGDDAWLAADDEIAEMKLREKKALAPLYGVIPSEQPQGWADKWEAVRQGIYLILSRLPWAKQ